MTMGSEDTLKSLVDEIQSAYTSTEHAWSDYAEKHGWTLFNQKSTRVNKCKDDLPCLNLITNYLVFLTASKVDQNFHRFGEGYVIDSRIKSRNSVDEKLDEYSKRKEDFNVNKCLNDLFGIRITIDDELPFEKISQLFKDNENLKCIDSSKPKDSNQKVYTATHIYFKSEGNRHFQWELQVWMLKDEVRNQQSHTGHRVKYTKWEGVRE